MGLESVEMVQLTNRPEPINDGSDGGDGLGRSLERLVVAQLRADGRGDEGEGTDDETALTRCEVLTWYCDSLTEDHQKDNVRSVATVS